MFAVALAALQAWNGRFLLNPDGVSYLDIADAYLRADWHNAVSTYWSPLYSGCLAGALVLRPPSVWEFAAVKLVNFAIFLGALAAFERLLRELTLQRPARANAAEESASLPRGVSLLVGYALFIGSSCVLTSVAYVSPDLLVSAFVYLLAAEALRVGRKGTTPARSLTFGLLLGLGCLAKAVLLPVGLVFLAASAFRTGSFRKAAVHVAAAAAVLLIVFGGFVAAMSAKAGRLTLGDVSRLNYLWIVNGVPDHGWLTDDPRLGAPTHPPLRLPCALPAYEYAGPAAATYPLWNDPPAWCDGLKWRFDARQQLAAVAASLLDYYYIFLSHLAPLTAALAALHVGAWLAGGGTLRARLAAQLRGLASDYPILLPALAACGLYGLVVVEPRYLAGFVVLLGVALLRGVRFPAARRDEAGRWAWAVTVVLVAAPMLWMGVQQAGAAVQGAADVPGQVARAGASWRPPRRPRGPHRQLLDCARRGRRGSTSRRRCERPTPAPSGLRTRNGRMRYAKRSDRRGDGRRRQSKSGPRTRLGTHSGDRLRGANVVAGGCSTERGQPARRTALLGRGRELRQGRVGGQQALSQAHDRPGRLARRRLQHHGDSGIIGPVDGARVLRDEVRQFDPQRFLHLLWRIPSPGRDG